jgi:hypothetical protein
LCKPRLVSFASSLHYLTRLQQSIDDANLLINSQLYLDGKSLRLELARAHRTLVLSFKDTELPPPKLRIIRNFEGYVGYIVRHFCFNPSLPDIYVSLLTRKYLLRDGRLSVKTTNLADRGIFFLISSTPRFFFVNSASSWVLSRNSSKSTWTQSKPKIQAFGYLMCFSLKTALLSLEYGK